MNMNIWRWDNCREENGFSVTAVTHPMVAALLGLSFGQEDHSPNSHLQSAKPEFWLQREWRPPLSQPHAHGPQALGTKSLCFWGFLKM